MERSCRGRHAVRSLPDRRLRSASRASCHRQAGDGDPGDRSSGRRAVGPVPAGPRRAVRLGLDRSVAGRRLDPAAVRPGLAAGHGLAGPGRARPPPEGRRAGQVRRSGPRGRSPGYRRPDPSSRWQSADAAVCGAGFPGGRGSLHVGRRPAADPHRFPRRLRLAANPRGHSRAGGGSGSRPGLGGLHRRPRPAVSVAEKPG